MKVPLMAMEQIIFLHERKFTEVRKNLLYAAKVRINFSDVALMDIMRACSPF